MDTFGTGERIAVLRKAAGLTQRQLAERSTISLSLLSKIEIGDRAASHAVVAAVARALHTTAERVHGQPYSDTPQPETIEALRAAVRRYDLPEDDVVPRPVHDLAADVSRAATLRRNARYAHLAALLPGLLTELTTAVHQPGDTCRQAWPLLANAYGAAHHLTYRLGYADLAETIADRLTWCASSADDPVLAAVAAWTRANAFQAAGDYAGGLALLDTARTRLERSAANGEASAVVLGSLHLRAVTMASRSRDLGETNDQITWAGVVADRLGHEAAHHHLTFGPANIVIHRVAARVELGQPREAVGLAERFTVPAGLAATRAGHHYIDVARGHLAAGDLAATLESLYRARAAAPEQTRCHPMAREATRVLLSRHRRSNAGLTSLATWLGLAI